MAHVQAPDFCTIEWSRYTGYALIVGGGATASWIIYLLTEPMAVMRLLANPFLVLELPLLFTCSVGFALFGYMLAAGRKGIVLFLRRFGNEQLNDAIRELMHSRLRRAFRLVLLWTIRRFGDWALGGGVSSCLLSPRLRSAASLHQPLPPASGLRGVS